MESTDIQLMARLASGHDEALNALMDRWKSRVAAYLFRATGEATVAADLAHETFVQLYQARHRYRPIAAFSTYLFGIAAHLVRQHRRTQSRRLPAAPISAGADEKPLEAVDTALTPDAAAAVRERLSEVEKALLTLPAELREALTLFVHEEMSYSEIATIVDATPKAVETRIYRARQLLKAALA
jgi:RNA polymerase sigma-70 factor, ECF subfamily